MPVHCEWLQSLSTNKCPCIVNDYSLLVPIKVSIFREHPVACTVSVSWSPSCLYILDISWTLSCLYNLDVSELDVTWSPSYFYSLDISWSPICMYSLAFVWRSKFIPTPMPVFSVAANVKRRYSAVSHVRQRSKIITFYPLSSEMWSGSDWQSFSYVCFSSLLNFLYEDTDKFRQDLLTVCVPFKL